MKQKILNEYFSQKSFDNRLTWYNEPDRWELKEGKLSVYPLAETDFWQKTHYGFSADSGHFLNIRIEGDFICETQVHCKFKNQYDQAGLMVRVSDESWMKTSVEFEPDEANNLGAVVTSRGYSDWSTQPVSDDFISFGLRITRTGSDYKVEFKDNDSGEWFQLRLFHLEDESNVAVGVYACSPKGAGFQADFDYLKIVGPGPD